MSRFTNKEISYTKSFIAQKSEDKQLFNCANPEQPCRPGLKIDIKLGWPPPE